ncbi:hypothetical protein TNCV_3391711 [Trichonephila clavipes]|nr:hypothetical protein TNCV_3391711 [Trichonephila clavipes]
MGVLARSPNLNITYHNCATFEGTITIRLSPGIRMKSWNYGLASRSPNFNTIDTNWAAFERTITIRLSPSRVATEKGVPAQVSSTSLDYGSKLRGPQPKALVQLNSATLMFNQSILHLEPKNMSGGVGLTTQIAWTVSFPAGVQSFKTLREKHTFIDLVFVVVVASHF